MLFFKPVKYFLTGFLFLKLFIYIFVVNKKQINMIFIKRKNNENKYKQMKICHNTRIV